MHIWSTAITMSDETEEGLPGLWAFLSTGHWFLNVLGLGGLARAVHLYSEKHHRAKVWWETVRQTSHSNIRAARFVQLRQSLPHENHEERRPFVCSVSFVLTAFWLPSTHASCLSREMGMDPAALSCLLRLPQQLQVVCACWVSTSLAASGCQLLKEVNGQLVVYVFLFFFPSSLQPEEGRTSYWLLTAWKCSSFSLTVFIYLFIPLSTMPRCIRPPFLKLSWRNFSRIQLLC